MNYSNEAPPAPEPTIPDTGKIISRLGLVLGLFVIMVGLFIELWFAPLLVSAVGLGFFVIAYLLGR